ncbi:MAG: hypothetical protein Q9222_000693 [Ikaeria aurantiellina]
MAFRVSAKRRCVSSTPASRSSDVGSGKRPSALRSSSVLQALNKKGYGPPHATRRLSLRSTSQPVSSMGSEADVMPETDASILEREEDDSMNEVIMALDLRDRGTVGCAYYIAREEKLYMMEDITSGGIEVVETLKLHVQPTVILLSTKVDESVSAYLESDGEHRDDEDPNSDAAGGFVPPYLLEVRPSPEFGYEVGKNKLCNISLVNDTSLPIAFVTPADAEAYQSCVEIPEPGYTGRQGKLLRLSGLVDLESRLTVGCAGAVLTYLQRRKAVVYLPGDDDAGPAFRISAVETFSLSGTM